MAITIVISNKNTVADNTATVTVKNDAEALSWIMQNLSSGPISIIREEFSESTDQTAATLNSSQAGLTCISNSSDLSELTSETFISFINNVEALPSNAFRVSEEIASRLSSYSIQSLNELLLIVALEALSSGDEIEIKDGKASNSIVTMSDRAKALQTATHLINIEELFSQEDWTNYGKESAAAAYHSMAAMFIKFNDLQSAEECLSLSDKLEDSPRSLALKALLAQNRGETLGAVANIVSSLQQYENRKNNDGTHYLSFTPLNIEVINTNLAEGLKALHEKNNEAALKSFTKAVCNFDSFYTSVGIDKEMLS